MLHHSDTTVVVDKKKNTPLHFLAKYAVNLSDYSRLLDELLDCPELSTLYNSVGNTPLHELAQHRPKKSVTRGRFSNIKAIKQQTKDSQLLLLNHCDIATVTNKRGNAPLHFLARFGSEEVREHIAELNTPIKNKQGQTPLDIINSTDHWKRI